MRVCVPQAAKYGIGGTCTRDLSPSSASNLIDKHQDLESDLTQSMLTNQTTLAVDKANIKGHVR